MATSRTALHNLTPKGKATRDRIIASAAKLMHERGVAATRTEDVQADAGGISPSQIYHYFGSKQSLVKAVIGYQTDQIMSAQSPMLAKLDSIEALEAWKDSIIDLQYQRSYLWGCPIGSLAGELAGVDENSRKQLAECFKRWEEAIFNGLRRMQARGVISEEANTASLAAALLTALQGGLLMTQVNRNSDALQAVLTEMIERIRFFNIK